MFAVFLLLTAAGAGSNPKQSLIIDDVNSILIKNQVEPKIFSSKFT